MRIGQLGEMGAPSRVSVSPAPSFDYKGVKLLIALPTRGDCSIDFACSLAVSVAMLTSAGVDVSIIEVRNSCFVDMNRNMALARFIETDCTHIWMIDDDMGWTRDAPLKMLAKDVDFIAGVGPMKSDSGEDYACHMKVDETGTAMGWNGLIEVERVGGAFVLMKRAVVERMIEAYPEKKCTAVDIDNGYSFYEHEFGSNFWKTEDYQFCDRWTAIGGQIWAYPDIDFTHAGRKDFKGNYHKFLLGRPKANESQIDRIVKDLNAPGPVTTDAVKVLLCQSYIDRIARTIINIQRDDATLPASAMHGLLKGIA